jgi:hypothetical protein
LRNTLSERETFGVVRSPVDIYPKTTADILTKIVVKIEAIKEKLEECKIDDIALNVI